MNPYQTIIDLLETAGVDYEVTEHEPVTTSEAASAVTGVPMEQGGKSLLLKETKGNTYVLCVVRGSNKLDYRKVRALIGSRKLRFATPEEVEEVMHCQIGACYPFGQIIGAPMLIDQTLAENEHISFSPGVHDKHIRMRWQDFRQVVADAPLADIVQKG